MDTSRPVPIPDERAPVPVRWRGEIERVLISQTRIQRRVRELSRQVERDFGGRDFVVGYGLDFAERYRNLPFIGVLHSHIYRELAKA